MPRLQSPARTAVQQWIGHIGIFGTYLFATSLLLSTAGASIGLALLVLGFVLDFRAWRHLRHDRVALASLSFALFVLAQSGYALTLFPAAAASIRETAGDWLKLLFFLPFAYWVGGDPARLVRLFGLALLGFLLSILIHIDWSDASWGFDRRLGFHLTAIAFGMFTGLGALGLLVLGPRFWLRTDSHGATVRGWRLGICLVLFLVFAQGLIQSYSRGSWIAFAVALLAVAVFYFRRGLETRLGSSGRLMLRIGAIGLATTVLLLAFNFDRIRERALVEQDTAVAFLAGDLDKAPTNSIGLRLNVWNFAVKKWLERPWLGWGAGSSRRLIGDSGSPELLMDGQNWLPHLHNTYLEILIQFGLVGLLLLALWLWNLVRAVAGACRQGQVPADVCAYLFGALVLVLVWNFFNYRAVHHDWRFFWILFAGGAYSFALRSAIESHRPALHRSDGNHPGIP